MARRKAASTKARKDDLDASDASRDEHGLTKGEHEADEARFLRIVEGKLARIEQQST